MEMTAQYRSPTRRPVQSMQNSESDKPLESQFSGMNIEDNEESLGASAERSPGRISGRNRDTAMFDPKRGTYLPYGDFDSVIDEYYTDGDPSAISIPAPSTMQRREQSRSPERFMPMRTQLPSSNFDQGAYPRHNGHARPDLARRPSNQSAVSSSTGDIHGSPGRSQNSPANNQGLIHSSFARAEQYYDDEPYYEKQRTQQRPTMKDQDYGAPRMPIASTSYERRGSNDRRSPMPPFGQHPNSQPRPRGYDDGGYAQPRVQRPPPQLRGQRSMDFPQQGRQAFHQGHPGPPMDPRRRAEGAGRDPRALQQDPRFAPRPSTGNDPRMRNGPGRQPMRPVDGPYPVDDIKGQRQPPPPLRGGEDLPHDARQPRRPFRNEPPGARNGIPPANPAPYPQEDRRLSDDQRARTPPGTRMLPDPRGIPAQNIVRDDRGRPPIQQPVPARPEPPRQEQLRQGTSVPVQQSGPQNLATRADVPAQAKTEDTSDMIMQSEPVGVVTLAELSQLRRDTAKGSNPVLQLKLVKRLMDAAQVLADEGGKADAKQTKKNKDDYSREALRTLKQITAQEKPYPEAVFFLANCYGNGALALEVDHERAFALYESAAKMQHPASAYRTAVCLEIGAGTRQDVDRAVRFYERAADYGDASAMYKVGMIFLRGLLGQKSDPKIAVTWLQKAAEKADIENPHALHELGLLYEKGDQAAGIAQNEPFARDLFTRAAKLHYAPSQFRMGYAYEYGTLGCPVDPRRSIAWFSRGAERGDPESELSLSGWYLTGSDGVLAQNEREAYLWGRKAAEKGLAKAEFAVGYFFESGIGTPVDIDEAIKWYKRAATAGQRNAQEKLLALGKRRK